VAHNKQKTHAIKHVIAYGNNNTQPYQSHNQHVLPTCAVSTGWLCVSSALMALAAAFTLNWSSRPEE
jgi:hypothetical protein